MDVRDESADDGRELAEDEVVELRSRPEAVDDGWGPGSRGDVSPEVERARSEVADAVDGSVTPTVAELVERVDDRIVPIDWQDVAAHSDADGIRMADDRPYVQAIPNDPERFQVITHGDADGLQADVHGDRIDLNVEQTASMIEANPDWGQRPVTLFGCSSGAGDFAQDLADRLDVDVTAPTDVVQVRPDGSTVVGSFLHPGEWVTYTPRTADESRTEGRR
jgi:hypothetical protein